MPNVILSVGQCGIDGPRLARMLRDQFGALVETAHSAEDARSLIAQKKYDLVLVNRIFDGNGGSGLELIQEIKREENSPPVMLISNYQDAQQQAVTSGALPGFGKSALSAPESLRRLQAVLTAAKDGPPATR